MNKRIICIIFVLTMLISMCIPVSAACSHLVTGFFEDYQYYVDFDQNMHSIYAYGRVVCTSCHQVVRHETRVVGAAGHTYDTTYHYTHNNYHSGAFHYYEYATSCTGCGRIGSSYWTSTPCNGNCQEPQNITDRE